MDKCEYQNIKNNNNCELKKTKSGAWKPFLKQLLITSGVWTSVLVYGLGVGAPTVFIPQIRKEANSTEIISDDMGSWLTSIYSFSGFPFVIILSIVTKFVGRKITFIIACVVALCAFILLYFSTSITHIIIGQVMQGLFSASQIVVTVNIVTEYTSPKYRGIFLTIKSATFYWGIWAANAIGTFFHWKMIALFGCSCTLYTLVTVFMWPESPYWLASRGRFEECSVSHRWLKGREEESEKELETLINSQKEYMAGTDDSSSIKERIMEQLKTIKTIEFYKPTLISILTGTLSIVSGKLVCIVYAIDIIKKITLSESTAYIGMLILDGITVLSMYVGCVLSKYCKRRTLLLLFSSVAVFFLLTISLYLYLIKLNLLTENNYISIFLLMAFSVAVSCGPLIMTMSIYGELIPVRSRNIAVCIIALCGKISIAITLKIAPYMFKAFGLHGVFLWFALSSLVCILLLYKYLPETKDKTLQEIADSMKGVKPPENNEAKLMLMKNI